MLSQTFFCRDSTDLIVVTAIVFQTGLIAPYFCLVLCTILFKCYRRIPVDLVHLYTFSYPRELSYFTVFSPLSLKNCVQYFQTPEVFRRMFRIVVFLRVASLRRIYRNGDVNFFQTLKIVVNRNSRLRLCGDGTVIGFVFVSMAVAMAVVMAV